MPWKRRTCFSFGPSGLQEPGKRSNRRLTRRGGPPTEGRRTHHDGKARQAHLQEWAGTGGLPYKLKLCAEVGEGLCQQPYFEELLGEVLVTAYRPFSGLLYRGSFRVAPRPAGAHWDAGTPALLYTEPISVPQQRSPGRAILPNGVFSVPKQRFPANHSSEKNLQS